MGEVQGLMPLKHTEISVGQTINWTIYNQDGQVLFDAGVYVEDQQQLNHLMEVGYCEADKLWDSIRPKLSLPKKQRKKSLPKNR